MKCIAISDIHLGHRNTPTEHITKNLYHYLANELKDSKYLFIAGDLFDRLLTIPDGNVAEIISFMSWLLRECVRYNVKLRVLEGTPSHDWQQNKLFETLAFNNAIATDIRYYDTLAIDTEEDGLNILYIPDEYSDYTSTTLNEVHQLLEKKGLTQVDLAIMHGMFEFQLPEHIRGNLSVHDSEAYLKIVKGYIIIGHDHRHKSKDRIYVPGSFDRLTHGEEEDKGYLVFDIDKKTIDFKVNKESFIYLTIECTKLDIEDTLKEIRDKLKDIPPLSKVRLIFKESHPIKEYINKLQSEYPDLDWTKSKVIKENEDIKLDVDYQYTSIIINEGNIVDVVMENIQLDKSSLKDRAKYLLSKIVEG